MAKVKAIKLGYYNHHRVKPGTVFDMPEVDEHGFYVDEQGKRKKFPKLNRKGEKAGEGERKCLWVDHVNTSVGVEVDPKELAAVLSGKNPGKKSVLAE